MGEVIAIHSLEELATVSRNKLVVVYFSATWSEPCRLISPVFHDLAKKLTNVTFLEVDVDEIKLLSLKFNVSIMPTFVFVKERVLVDQVSRASKDELENKIEKHMIA
ncbi:hypothetical protein CFC21_100832 [Triticum aestivum]|uniref:Thioredoxin domain-containing protein n=2 Tax=Triticum aestivum TaxID=4565 RepID=A0A3B6RPN4_WHEAT|nr:thioredoxin H5-like [Triticum dicoccoides]XP_044428396.1 thioredoxin H5-like [Triticum aestivum]KAF7099157.1 hypothetical protein CFC21_100832 [Triticum aestivum]